MSNAQKILDHLFNPRSTWETLQDTTFDLQLVSEPVFQIDNSNPANDGLAKIMNVNGCRIMITLGDDNPIIGVKVEQDTVNAGWIDSRLKYGYDQPYRRAVTKLQAFFAELESNQSSTNE